MYVDATVSILLLLAANALAASPLALSFTKSGQRPSFKTKKLLKSRALDLPLSNLQGVQYNVNLTVGTPPQDLGVQLDTGSSNFWIPATTTPICADDGCYLGAYDANKSSTYTYINDTFLMEYYDPSDYDAGDYITDNVGIAGVVIKDMSIGVAYDAVDAVGVLGISFTFEEEGMYEPTLIDLLKSQGAIDRKAYSMYLNDIDTNAGSIIFGGIDTTKYSGELISLPMQPDYNYNVTDFSIALTSVTMTDASGPHEVSLSNYTTVAAVLDSGTFDMELPTDIANSIAAGMGAVWTDEDGYVVPCEYGERAEATFIFNFGGPTGPNISVPLKEMLSDADFRFHDGRRACSLGIDPADTELGGLVILGDSFLRSAYVVYDLENLEIALAQAKYGVSGSHVVNIPAGTGLPGVTSTATVGVPTALATAGGPALTALVPATPTYDLGTAVPSAKPTSGAAVRRGEEAVVVGSVAMAVLLGVLGIA